MPLVLAFALALTACEAPSLTPCEVRAVAVCAYYAACYEGNDVEPCERGNVAFCEAPGAAPVDMARAKACAAELDAATCAPTPASCWLRESADVAHNGPTG